MPPLLAGIEAGGTKIICTLGYGPQRILAQTRLPTRTPAETLPRLYDFFKHTSQQHGQPQALGVASFGPLDLHSGRILATPKTAWQGFNWKQALADLFPVPIVVDTDVNGAALAEWRWGAARGLTDFLYLTIGTGIGGGGMVNGGLLHGQAHPEMGHMPLARNPQTDPFNGICPFHGDCLEGLASGPALAARWGKPAESLPDTHPAWALEAEYLAQALHTLVAVLAPQRILLGGGVMQTPHLLPKIRDSLQKRLQRYWPAIQTSDLVQPPALGTQAGPLGALALAKQALVPIAKTTN